MHAPLMDNTTAERSNADPAAFVVVVAALQLSSSQKQSVPRPLLCDMQTWSTMKRLICSCEVHVRQMLYSAAERIGGGMKGRRLARSSETSTKELETGFKDGHIRGFGYYGFEWCHATPLITDLRYNPS